MTANGQEVRAPADRARADRHGGDGNRRGHRRGLRIGGGVPAGVERRRRRQARRPARTPWPMRWKQDSDRLMAILAREGGKTLDDCIDEVREAVDFCRYYAAEAERMFAGPSRCPGRPAKPTRSSCMGRGVFVCISPWNFPLAIFTGQIAGGAGGGQHRGRQARRTDAARSLRGGEAVPRGGPAGRGAASPAPATARSAASSPPIRAAAASPSPARPKWRASSTARLRPRMARSRR